MREIKFRHWNDYTNKMEIDTTSKLISQFNLLSEFFKDIQARSNIMQFTGLKDKNGVEIYEGDIIEVNNWIYVVKFKNGKFLCFQNVDDELATGSINSETDEVIGNIYENPELLKE